MRDFDSVGRYGGEEFIVVLSNCDIEAAKLVCERIRASVADEPITENAVPIHATVSIGLAYYNGELDSIERIVGAADAALYRAKNLGRNRVEVKGATELRRVAI